MSRLRWPDSTNEVSEKPGTIQRGRTAPGAGHEEPVFPWSRADFRHHVLRLVREYVPTIMEELHTIVDLSDPD